MRLQVAEQGADLFGRLDVATTRAGIDRAAGHFLVEENNAADVMFAEIALDGGAVGGRGAAEADDEELADFLAERGSGGHGGIF